MAKRRTSWIDSPSPSCTRATIFILTITAITTVTAATMPRCTFCSKTYSEGTLRDHRASSHLGVVCYFPHTSYPDLPAEDDEEMTRRLMEANSQRGGGQSGNVWVC